MIIYTWIKTKIVEYQSCCFHFFLPHAQCWNNHISQVVLTEKENEISKNGF